MWAGFVVAGRAPVVHEPARGPLSRPPAWRNGETPGGGVATDDVHIDAEGGCVFDEMSTVPAVDPGLAKGGMLDSDLLDEGLTGDRVLHARRGDQHLQEQADRVDHAAPLPPHDLLSRVDVLAGRGTLVEGLMLREPPGGSARGSRCGSRREPRRADSAGHGRVAGRCPVRGRGARHARRSGPARPALTGHRTGHWGNGDVRARSRATHPDRQARAHTPGARSAGRTTRRLGVKQGLSALYALGITTLAPSMTPTPTAPDDSNTKPVRKPPKES